MQSLRAAGQSGVFEELARPVWLEPGEQGEQPCGCGGRQGHNKDLASYHPVECQCRLVISRGGLMRLCF